MTPHPHAARIGLFALGALALLIAAVVVVFGGGLLTRTEPAVMHFSGSVYGLQVGSPVVFRGVRIGSVREVGVVYEQGRFAVPVRVALDRDRLGGLQEGPHGSAAPSADGLHLAALVERGLSAQLATQSLLTGQLYVDLDLRGPGRPARRDARGVVEIPTSLTRFQSLQDQLDRVDLQAMARDLGQTLQAARGLLAGPELKQALAELGQASAALARVSATLEQRAGPLVDTARQTLVQAGQAATRVGGAAERLGGQVGTAADRVGAAAGRAEQLLAPGSPLLASAQQAADELARSAAALRQATADDSATVQGLQRALQDVSRASRALRELADAIEQQPQALIRGRVETPP